jgi:predicted dehydrogenase
MRATSVERDDKEPGTIALIGAGAFGRFCLNAYQGSDRVRVVAVVDSSDEALRLAAPIAPQAQLLRDWRDLAAIDNVSAIHVATPPFLRAEIVDAMLSSGKSVFCEKPLALSLAEADRMIAAAEYAGVALGVNYVMRHLPAYRMLVDLVNSRLLGMVRTISFQNFAGAVSTEHWFWDPRRSGGILVEHGVHFFDAYSRITGPVVDIWCEVPRREAIDVHVRYADGTVGRYYHEFAFPRVVERTTGIVFLQQGYIEIDGWIPTRLSAVVDGSEDTALTLAQLVGEDAVMRRGDAIRVDLLFPDRNLMYQAAIVAGMCDLLLMHRDTTYRMAVTAIDARESLRVALAAGAERKDHVTRSTM